MNVEKAMKQLQQRGFQVSHFPDRAQAAEHVCSQITGCTVGIGGSKTVEALGLFDRLTENNTVYWHWKEPGRATQEKALLTDVYICSANAISEEGEIFNIDGTGNRLAATVFGHKKVFIVAGTNKLAPDFDSALYRARNVAAVQNCARFGKKTPCQVDGKCHDCRSQERICRALTVLWAPMNGMETEVVLIDEDLGM
ncbi:MAG: lactate utilization protein [Oscillospiraceae bacterium]|nr:lactate utilization protein [Oscillospiraceae bacterium]